MSTQTPVKEEENLIILDDTSSNTNELELTPEVTIEDASSSNELIDFGWSEEKSEQTEEKIETTTNNELDLSFDSSLKTESNSAESNSTEVTSDSLDISTTDTIDLSLDIDTTNSTDELSLTETVDTESTTIPETDSLVTEKSTEDLNLDTFSSEDTSSSLSLDESVSSENSGMDLNSILDETIIKLSSREESIQVSKWSKQDDINDLKAKITELEKQVESAQSEVDELNKESRKIWTNIKSLEKMKLSSVYEVKETQKQTRAKAHNTKRSR